MTQWLKKLGGKDRRETSPGGGGQSEPRRRGSREDVINNLMKLGLTKEEATFELSEREKAGERILAHGPGTQEQKLVQARAVAFAPVPLFLPNAESFRMQPPEPELYEDEAAEPYPEEPYAPPPTRQQPDWTQPRRPFGR